MRRYISVLIVAISIAATSCSNFLVKEESTPPEGAFVTLAVGKTGSRTILPESYDEVASLVNFTFTATGTTGAKVTQTFTDYDTLQTAQLFFTPGIYDCRLSVTSTAGVKYEGVLEDTVISPGDNVLSFNLQVVQLSADPGSLEVQLTFPGTNVAVVKAGLYSIAGEALDGFPEEVLEITSGNTVTYSKDRVPGGSHLIQFSFYGDAEYRMFLGMHTESVVIVSGKKSAATRSIESINQMYTITYELDGGSFVEGYTAPEKFTSGMEFQLPKVSKVRKSGMSFFGWYTDAAFTGSPVYSLPQGTCENKVYYAKWGTFTAETIDAIDLGSVAGDYDLVISGPITSDTISTLKSKISAAGTSAKIHLDLSQTTGLTSIGNHAFSYCRGLTSVTFGEGSRLWSIGSRAFYGCSGLTSVEIPASVTSIGDYAFEGCSGLTRVEIPSSVTSIGSRAFYGCSGLTSVTFGAGSQLKSIGSRAFYRCTGLTSVEIPASVTSIDDYAFLECSGLTSVTFGAGSQLKSIGSRAFSGCSGLTSVEISAGVVDSGLFPAVTGECRVVVTGEITGFTELRSMIGRMSAGAKIRLDLSQTTGLTSIGDSAFSGCSGLTSVEIPSSVTSIGNSAFEGCSGLTSVEIPASVTSIDDYAFSGCSGLTSVEIPASVTSIGNSAFEGCSGLTSVYYQGGLARWCEGFEGRYTLMSYCRNLYINGELVQGDLVIPAGVTSIGSWAFYGCSGLTSVEIPASVTSIGGRAFEGCSGLTSVYYQGGLARWCEGFEGRYTLMSYCRNLYINGELVQGDLVIPAGVTSIGDYAFWDCSGLTSVEIPASVTSIGDSAFSGCSGLTNVEIPASVTSIGRWAFLYCSGLTSVEIPASVTSIRDSAFEGCSGLSSVEIPASVTSIGDWAFDGCSGLSSVEIPASVTFIGDYAFYGCSGLTSVEIPASVTSIDNYAFSGCSGLTSVTFGDTSGWYVTKSKTDAANKTGGRAVFPSPTDLAANATLVNGTYDNYYWYKVD